MLTFSVILTFGICAFLDSERVITAITQHPNNGSQEFYCGDNFRSFFLSFFHSFLLSLFSFILPSFYPSPFFFFLSLPPSLSLSLSFFLCLFSFLPSFFSLFSFIFVSLSIFSLPPSLLSSFFLFCLFYISMCKQMVIKGQ